MTLKNFLMGVMLSCVLLFTAGSSIADTISYTDSFSNLLTELQDEPLRVQQFDSSLGTLNSVSVSWTGYLKSDGSVTNNAAGLETATVSTRGQLYEGTLQGLASGLDATFDVFAPFALITEQEFTLLSPGVPAAFGPADINNSGVLTPTELTPFIGTGEFGYDFTTRILTSISGGGGNFGTDIQTSTSATLIVVYDYDVENPSAPIPEPATFMLFGLGLMGLAHRCRRKNT